MHSVNEFGSGPFSQIGRIEVDLLPTLFKQAKSIANFTHKELCTLVPELNKEAITLFCNVLDRNSALAYAKELNIPHASPRRYTLTTEGVQAITDAEKDLAKILKKNKQHSFPLPKNKRNNSLSYA